MDQELIINPIVQDIARARELSRAELEKLSDEDLILLFQQDLQVAYDILVARFKNPLMNFIYRYVGNSDDAADLLQETFIRLYRKKHLYQTIARFSTWIYTIAANIAKTELRKPYRRYTTPIHQSKNDDEEYEIPLPDSKPEPDRVTDSTLKGELIQQALLKIPAVFREAVVLRDIQDLPYEEIAEIIGMPIGTVKSRINRGRNQLQKLLKNIYD